MVVRVAKLLTQHGQPLEGVRHLHFLGHAHATVELDRLLTYVAYGVTDVELGG
jgi:hypothetical protein